MRRVSVFSISVASVMAATGSVAVAARDQITMPYSCEFDRGRLALKAAGERRYPIVGGRHEQPATVCKPGQSRDCRTMMVHRFSIICGGRRVAWARVAAALPRGSGSGKTWVEQGRLGVELGPRRMMAPRGCAEGDGRCANRTAGGGEATLLPAGFAPVGELGARLLLGSPGGDMQSVTRQIAALPPPVEAEALPELNATPAVLDARDAMRNWNTVIRLDSTASTAAAPAIPQVVYAWPGRDASRLAMWSAILAALAALVWAAAQHRHRVAAALAGNSRRAGLFQRMRAAGAARFRDAAAPDRDAGLTNASHSVNALLTQARIAVGALSAAAPLREVLENELEIIRQRLAVASASASESAAAAARAAPVFRILVRDLERIRRIAESAATSLDGSRDARAVPKTRAEAFELLGVNPDVSDAVLKKVVDALRMSWHPDHARDEQDRELRDARTKQINVAWDLVTGKRATR